MTTGNPTSCGSRAPTRNRAAQCVDSADFSSRPLFVRCGERSLTPPELEIIVQLRNEQGVSGVRHQAST